MSPDKSKSVQQKLKYSLMKKKNRLHAELDILVSVLFTGFIAVTLIGTFFMIFAFHSIIFANYPVKTIILPLAIFTGLLVMTAVTGYFSKKSEKGKKNDLKKTLIYLISIGLFNFINTLILKFILDLFPGIEELLTHWSIVIIFFMTILYVSVMVKYIYPKVLK